MALKVLLLGRPGSGKTTAAHYLLKLASEYGLHASHIDDYDILQEKFQADPLQQRFRPLIVNGVCCGFDVLDFSVMDEVLTEAEARVERHLARYPAESITFLEFARDDYFHAFHRFRRGFLHDAAIIYFRIDPETSIQRVRERYLKTGYQLVSEQVLRGYYRDDGFCAEVERLQRAFNIHRTIEICDNSGSWQAFFRRLQQLFSAVLGEHGTTPAAALPQATRS
jgi:adenylate kinase family enzyme